MKAICISALAATLLTAAPVSAAPPATISTDRIKTDVRTLASDRFEGRGPGETGEARTVPFLAQSFAAAGLEPAGIGGKWTQDVPLVRLDRLPGARIILDGRSLTIGRDITLGLRNAGRWSSVNAPLVFAGWGVVDAKLGFDAYRGVDMRGKIAVLLANDPDFEAGHDLGFGGKALVLAGRTGTKVAAAAKAGAAGVIFVHEEAAYSFPFSQFGNTVAVPSMAYDPLQPSTLGFSAVVRKDIAEQILRGSGLTLAALKVRARLPEFRAIPLRAKASVSGFNKTTRFVSHNVVAKLTGATRPTEYVLYGAHWDANGRNGPDSTGDEIRNGAIDNATGTAEMLEIARAFAAGKRPARTVVFGAWTAEEKGLLGSEWFAAHPLVPLERIAAVINLDPHLVLPEARSIELIGPGKTDLEPRLALAAGSSGLKLVPEPIPEAGWYYRSDHLPFAQRGVPSIAFRAGRDLVQGGMAQGTRAVAAFNARCYHQPCDEFSSAWTFGGTGQEATTAYRLGLDVANTRAWPNWNPGNEYFPMRQRTAAERR
jgi:Zn-dependent M28 family amino/carboxypeptidase